MPKKSKIIQRQQDYNVIANQYKNVLGNDALRIEKIDVNKAFVALSAEINKISPYNLNGEIVKEQEKVITHDEMMNLISCYKNAIDSLDKLLTKTNQVRDIYYDRLMDGDDRYFNKVSSLNECITLYEKQLKHLSKDLNAFNKAYNKGGDAVVVDVFEDARIDSTYEASFPENAERNHGAQNERIPIILKKDGVEKEGYFTLDNCPTKEDSVEKAYFRTTKKYGSKANFLDYRYAMQIFRSIYFGGPELKDAMFSKKNTSIK